LDESLEEPERVGALLEGLCCVLPPFGLLLPCWFPWCWPPDGRWRLAVCVAVPGSAEAPSLSPCCAGACGAIDSKRKTIEINRVAKAKLRRAKFMTSPIWILSDAEKSSARESVAMSCLAGHPASTQDGLQSGDQVKPLSRWDLVQSETLTDSEMPMDQKFAAAVTYAISDTSVSSSPSAESSCPEDGAPICLTARI
jgi:hypothetical protein